MVPKRILSRGIIAGLIGATILALWFLLIDTLRGQPFATPSFLAGVLAGVEATDRSLSLIVLYTLLHYAAFGAVGVAMAWLLTKLEACPPILLGLVLGFILFDLVFYSGVVLTGVDVVERLGWPEVLAGNLFAGVGTIGYLHTSLGLQSPQWVATLLGNRILREGVIVGVVGALVVAVWFFLFDLVQGRMLFTPGALGSAFFLRVADASEVQIGLLTVGGYTIVHFAGFIAIGLAAATVAVLAEQRPPLILLGLLVFVTFEAFFLGLLAVVAEWLLGALGWMSVGIGNLLAAAAMAFVLWREHPKLRAALGPQTFSTDETDVSSPAEPKV